MGSAIKLRGDFDGSDLRRLAKRSRNGGQSRRLLALAEIYDGKRRSDAARLADVGLQIIRDWVLRFNSYQHALIRTLNAKLILPARSDVTPCFKLAD